MYTGIVVTVADRGFGFIKPDDPNTKKDIFFHVSGLMNTSEFDEITKGQKVKYDIDTETDPGRPRAVRVEKVE